MYNYENEKSKIFTDDGQKDFIKIRDKVKILLDDAGAFMMEKIFITGNTWTMLACVDRLVELGEIIELTTNGAGQHRVFVASS